MRLYTRSLYISLLLIFIHKVAGANDSTFVKLLNRAREHIALHEYSKALLLVDSCIKIKNDDATIYNLRGCITIYQSSINDKRNNQAAINFFTKATQIDSGNNWYYNNRGWAHQNLESYSNALKDFNKAVTLDTNNVYLHGNVLRTLWLQNKNRDAFACSNKIIQLFPEDGYAYYVRGQLKRDYLHKYPEGNKDIKKSEALGWQQGILLYY